MFKVLKPESKQSRELPRKSLKGILNSVLLKTKSSTKSTDHLLGNKGGEIEHSVDAAVAKRA